MPFANILVATDFSGPARRAVAVAASLAHRCGAKLTLAHVFDPAPLSPFITYPTGLWTDASLAEQLSKDAHEAMERVKARLSPLEVAAHVVEETSEAGGICDLAASTGADLVVLGSYGRTGMARFLLGSVAEKVVRHAPCNVLISRWQGQGPADDEATDDTTAALDKWFDVAAQFPTRMQVCTDLSPTAAEALMLASKLAKAFGTRAKLLHAEDPRHDDLAPEVHRTVTNELTKDLGTLYNAYFIGEPNVAVLKGANAAEAITTHALRSAPDLLVLATHGRTGLQRLIMGSVAESVTRHAPCSVLVTRPAAATE